MRYIIVLLITVLLGCAETSRSTNISSQLPIRIGLDYPVDQIEGHSWPVSDGNLLEFTATEASRTVVISFPSGRIWKTQSKITFFSQRDGQVASIIVSPLNETGDLENVLGLLRNTTEELETGQNALVVQRLGGWLAKPPVWSPFATQSVGCELEPGITFFAEIKPANENNKWYLSYHFTADRFFHNPVGSKNSNDQ
jgi:hypothetical protein